MVREAKMESFAPRTNSKTKAKNLCVKSVIGAPCAIPPSPIPRNPTDTRILPTLGLIFGKNTLVTG